jgi:hypothetical protein
MNLREGWKVLSHDYRPPIQGGEPLWDGVTLPVTLPVTRLDKSEADCAEGWNYCGSLATALKIAGLWRDGRPVVAVRVEASADAIERQTKRRASQLTIVARAADADIEAAIRELSAPFGAFADDMTREQMAWYVALGRPLRDEAAVEEGLVQALRLRGLDWKTRRIDTAWDARAAWAARAARDAWAARDARAAWDARDAWAAWDARAARDAWDAWAARDARAARDAWAAWDAWDAWDALTVRYASLQGWVEYAPGYLTDGLRDAYRNGLALALPTGPNELGWAMVE